MKRDTGEMQDLKNFMHVTICELIFSNHSYYWHDMNIFKIKVCFKGIKIWGLSQLIQKDDCVWLEEVSVKHGEKQEKQAHKVDDV